MADGSMNQLVCTERDLPLGFTSPSYVQMARQDYANTASTLLLGRLDQDMAAAIFTAKRGVFTSSGLAQLVVGPYDFVESRPQEHLIKDDEANE